LPHAHRPGVGGAGEARHDGEKVKEMKLSLPRRSALHWKRALITFAAAYLTITAVGIGLFFAIAAVQHTGSYANPMNDPSYIVEEKVLPLANLAIWTLFALVYLGKRRGTARLWHSEPVQLGTLWLALGLLADLVSVVLVKSPYSMTASDFYVRQFPWIYLIYLAVFLSPLCAAALQGRLSRPGARVRSTWGWRPPA
jgi:hypothetical protein